jgi:four helix bundle protein
MKSQGGEREERTFIDTPDMPSIPYALQPRTLLFAKNVREFVKKIPRTLSNLEDAKQLVRSSGSVCANYIESDEALGKRDRLFRMRICRKKSKESAIFLHLLDVGDDALLNANRNILQREARELLYIFSSIIREREAHKKT